MLPGVDTLLEAAKTDPFFEAVPKSVRVSTIRTLIEELREEIFHGGVTGEAGLAAAVILDRWKRRVLEAMSPNLQRTVNATGVVIHTNLGRSLLADVAIENLKLISGGYSNLEFDLAEGKRGSRYSAVEDILCEITGAEAGMVVNNNAGAVLLSLDTLAHGRQVIVSRGELVEIGGSFRIPDVMAKSGGILKEVGTTNRTHLRDYESAIESDTGLLLKVHRSNYSVVGFTAEVTLTELVELGARYHVPVMEDLGSGMFIDFSRYGLMPEPTVQEAVATGADVVTFSGDKLLGGPQAGIIVGKKEMLDRIKKNPITRALRIDKLTLAALESTLRLYRDERTAVEAIPTLRMLTLPLEEIDRSAETLATELGRIGDPRLHIRRLERSSRAGGGSMPMLELPSRCIGISIEGMSVNRIERFLRGYCPPVIGRIEEDTFVIDPRTLLEEDRSVIIDAFEALLKEAHS